MRLDDQFHSLSPSFTSWFPETRLGQLQSHTGRKIELVRGWTQPINLIGKCTCQCTTMALLQSVGDGTNLVLQLHTCGFNTCDLDMMNPVHHAQAEWLFSQLESKWQHAGHSSRCFISLGRCWRDSTPDTELGASSPSADVEETVLSTQS